MNEKVKKLLEKPQPVQRTSEWFEARKLRITASSVSSLLVRDENTCKKYVELYNLDDIFMYDNKSCNPYSSKEQFIMDKIKQSFQGSPATFWGQKYEPIATNIYELKCNCNVIEFGLLTHDTIPWLAASPDGITEDGVMLEIKCPYRRKITGVPSLNYYQQVQIQLEVADLDVCDFLEVEFIEISSMEEFIDDSLQDEEVEMKGLFLQIETIPDDFTKRKYIYPPKDLYNDIIKLNEWRDKAQYEFIMQNDFSILKNFNGNVTCINQKYEKISINVVYWKTRIISIVRIDRDRAWFANIKNFLKEQWDDVLHKKENYKDKIHILQEEVDRKECLF